MTHDLAPSAVVGLPASWSARRDWTTRAPATRVPRRCSLRSRTGRGIPGAGAVRPRGGRQHVRSRRPLRPAELGARADRAGRAAAAGRTSCARWPARCARPATWHMPPTRTTRTGTSPRTGSRSTEARCSRSTRTCATPPTRPARALSRWPAIRRACRCSAMCTARTCRAARRSARSPPSRTGLSTVDVGAAAAGDALGAGTHGRGRCPRLRGRARGVPDAGVISA